MRNYRKKRTYKSGGKGILTFPVLIILVVLGYLWYQKNYVGHGTVTQIDTAPSYPGQKLS
jgi:predicted negative regulator of RcsB-dependent stress response